MRALFLKKNIIKSYFILGFLWLLGIIIFPNTIFANAEGDWGHYGTSPIEILNKVVDDANEDFTTQETKLDRVSNKQWSYGVQYRITNTLDYFRKNINPYLQWAVYIGLVGATILLIWNGFQLTTKAVNKGADIKKAKENIMSIAIGVIIMTGFMAILRLVVAVLNYFFL